MNVRAVGLGSARNGMPVTFRPYVYRGTGVDVLTPAPPPRTAVPRQEGEPGLPGRVLAALRSLGGEASTPKIRAALELDGGAAFHPNYVLQVLSRLSSREPPAVTPAGRESDGKGRPGRWRLGPGAGEPVADKRTQPLRRPAAAANPRCRRCGYLKTADGHKNACGGGGR